MRLSAPVRLEWYGWVFCGYAILILPGHLVAGGLILGAAGASLGFGTIWLNARIFRSSLHLFWKAVLIALLSFLAIVLYTIPTAVLDFTTRYGSRS
ncbi:MAG TPA: hypothetical protein VGS58_14565 [Candidatus Sulfopaludibacter sp.]|nr:hypothetical protein [Candidatus Sulfopaludibacter sp.]